MYMYTTENADETRGTQIVDKYEENFEVYTEELDFETIKDDDIADLYFHDNCVEVIYYTNNAYKPNTMDTSALRGRTLRITLTYKEARNILLDLGYEFYANRSLEMYSDCLYSEKNNDNFKRMYLGELIREIWTKKENIKPFRFERCAIPEKETDE